MSEPIHRAATSEPKSDGGAIEALLERIERCVTDISLGFDRWDDPHARGPGLYFVVVWDSIAEFAVPMGSNRWPIEACATVGAEGGAFRETAQGVAMSCDGAVVVHSTGTIEEQMVRVAHRSPADGRRDADLPYEGWMGARHMSAIETSTRTEVIATITLSEEDGRVSVFTDGTCADSLATTLATE